MNLAYATVSNDRTPLAGASGADGAPAERSQLDEAALVQNARRAQEGAFEQLWRTHAHKVLGTTYRITRNCEDAEDALQDSFLSAFLHIKDFDGRSAFSTWLRRIAINSALMILRKRRAAIEMSPDVPENAVDNGGSPVPVNLADSNATLEALFAQREREELLQEAVAALRPSIRRALELHKLQELSINETAETLGLSVTAAKSRLYQAKAKLRSSLKPETIRGLRGSSRTRLTPAA